MSFVFPALLATTVLAGIPILLHLILRQRPKSLPFPAFRFLVARHQTNQRKLQLRHWLLLALRILLIAGIIFAIARPRLLQHNLGLSSERPVAAVFVLDVSASMEARSSDSRTRLDDAKKRALEFLDELPPGSRIAVLSSADSRGEWLTNPFQARQRIQNFKIEKASPPLPRTLVAALRLLNGAATKSQDDAALPRLLCVFSDTTRGCWQDAQSPHVLEASDLVPVPRESLLDVHSAVGPLLGQLKDDGPLKELLLELRDTLPRLNAASFPLQDRPRQLVQQTRAAIRELLKSLATSESSAKDETKTKLAAGLRGLLLHLTGYQTMWFDVGLDPPRDLAVVDVEWPLSPSGRPLESVRPGAKIHISPILQALGQDFEATVTVGAVKKLCEVKSGGRKNVPFEIDTAQKTGGRFHSLEFDVDLPDALGVNNRRYATITVRAPRKVLIIATTMSLADDDFYRALISNNVGQFYDAEFDVKTPAEAEADISPTKYDAAFLYAIPVPSEKLWGALGTFASAGGGVAIIPGAKEMNVKAYQTPAAKAVLPGVYESSERLGEKSAALWNWQEKGVFRHPLLQPFEGWLLDSNIYFVKMPPRVFEYWETAAKADVVLLRYNVPKRSPALLEKRLGAGKVLQLTTPLGLYEPRWNNYSENISPFVVIVAGLMVRHLTGELEMAHVNFELGREEASLPTRHLGRGPLMLVGPEGGQITIDEKAPFIALPQATLPGNYQILNGKTTVAAFSMNLPADEIDLTPWPPADIENLFGAGVRVPPNRQANLRQLIQGRFSEPVELFPILMVALLVLLAIENLLANRFYRRDAEPV
jgi:hypothetical protein